MFKSQVFVTFFIFIHFFGTVVVMIYVNKQK